MNAPTVSVLMPVYNANRYVAKAIESILSQNFGDFEFLIVDDGSTDGSRAILERYARHDGRIRLVSRPNAGYVSALNEMLERARGTFLARMDADDIAMPERLNLQVAFLKQHQDVVCVGGDYGLIDHAGRFLTRMTLPRDHAGIEYRHLRGQTSIAHPAAMMRVAAVRSAGGYDLSMYPTEDLDLWLRLGERGELRNLDRVVLHYRIHDQSVSATRADLQRTKVREACERAWARRDIWGEFDATGHSHPSANAASRHEFALRFGWWAFKSGQRRTAMVYGGKAIWSRPLCSDGWRLLACTMIKRCP